MDLFKGGEIHIHSLGFHVWEVRTADYAYVEYVTGERELYDMQLDPYQLENVVSDPAYADAVARLASALLSLRTG